MTPRDFGASLAAQAPALTADQIEDAARLLLSVLAGGAA